MHNSINKMQRYEIFYNYSQKIKNGRHTIANATALYVESQNKANRVRSRTSALQFTKPGAKAVIFV